ncbi:MAG: hypothetical protein IJ622_03650 [Bacteroidales bacterium]|nr:hypothetical protein [Bacteroidales bacterium]
MKRIAWLLVVILTGILFTSCYKDVHIESHSEITVNNHFDASVGTDTIVQDTVVIQSKVTLLGLSELTRTSAIVEGVVEGSCNQAHFAYGICWGTSPNPTIENYHCDSIRFIQSKHFEITIVDLTPNTKYYVRPFLVASNEYIYGEKSDSFTTNN